MGISSSMVDPASASALTALATNEVIYEFEDYLYFQHDLCGDWARYKIIRSHAHEIKTFLLSIDIVSPLWAKAIRQYGIFLLEVKGSEHGWLKLYQLFDEHNPKEKILKDILLESSFLEPEQKKIFNSSRKLFYRTIANYFSVYSRCYLQRQQPSIPMYSKLPRPLRKSL